MTGQYGKEDVISNVSQSIQKAVDEVEVWANNWSFRLFMDKTEKSTRG